MASSSLNLLDSVILEVEQPFSLVGTIHGIPPAFGPSLDLFDHGIKKEIFIYTVLFLCIRKSERCRGFLIVLFIKKN